MEDNAAVELYKRKHRTAGVPPESIVTEGDLQMKQLVQKQMNTDVSLQGQLAKVKHFSHGTVYKMPTDQVAGLISPLEFNRLVEEGQHLEELRQFGLSEDEIALKLQHDSSKSVKGVVPKSRYGIDPLAHAERLTCIEDKIKEKEKLLQEPTTFSGAKAMSRHEMDLEQAIGHDRSSSKMLNCLLTKKSMDSVIDPDHPINHLDSILADILPHKNTHALKRQKRKRRRKADPDNQMEEAEPEIGCCVKPCSSTLSNSESLSSTDRFTAAEQPAESVITGESFSSPKTAKKPLIKLDYNSIESIPLEVIERYRLSIAQIKELPRFTNYESGPPSKTLFLKNLSARVTEEDLVALFFRFQVPGSQPIEFKLLHGKMKGQAFITFDSAEKASEALNLVNGYDFKGKPIIIEFGKKNISIT